MAAMAEDDAPEPGPAFRNGTRAVLCGLVSMPEFNEQVVEIMNWDTAKERWVCRTCTNGLLNVRSENLRPTPHEASPSGDTARSWRIDTSSVEPLVGDGGADAPQKGSTGWHCRQLDQFGMESGSIITQVCRRWGRHVEELASRHVAGAFGRLHEHLRGAAGRSAVSGTEVAVLPALAGSDFADHEATMGQAEELVRESFPASCVASVGPESFHNPAATMRRITVQLLRGASAAKAANRMEDALGEAVVDEAIEGEWPIEDQVASNQSFQVRGALDFIDWYRDSSRTDTVVILVKHADAVGAESLREVLNCWGAACCEHGIPLLVVLGLQHPPQSRFDLLGGETLTPLRLLDAVHLFDARAVCARLLEQIIEDPLCPLALTPELLLWMRDHFLHKCHSVTRVLTILVLLFEQFHSENPFAVLCSPLDDQGVGGAATRPDRAQLVRVFTQRFEENPNLVAILRTMWPAEGESTAAAAAEAAADATAWRWRLYDSFGVWEALLCTIQPLACHEARLRRLCKLLTPIWPQRRTQDPGAAGAADERADGATDAEREAHVVGELMDLCLAPFDPGSSLLSRSDLEKLVRGINRASTPLDTNLQGELAKLSKPSIGDAQLRKGLRSWLCQFREQYWQPLQGPARDIFIEGFSCERHLARAVEPRLACKVSSAADDLLLPLARGGERPDDVALLYRLLECFSGKSVEVADLWQAFMEHAPPEAPGAPGDDAAALARFSQALLALHALGLHAPQATKSERPEADGKPFRGWQVRKRNFGCLWKRRVVAQDPAGDFAVHTEGPAPEPGAAAAPAASPATPPPAVEGGREGGPPCPGSPPPASAQARQRRFFTPQKPQPPPPGAAPRRPDAAKYETARDSGRKRARIFMG
mmetsp:Transcript_114555/g.324478  ORF Transcript_114555/g.324478 Transcript_114555/m.324478 type:complete len:880 (-) Transcript_114555:261-2900(-)